MINPPKAGGNSAAMVGCALSDADQTNKDRSTEDSDQVRWGVRVREAVLRWDEDRAAGAGTSEVSGRGGIEEDDVSSNDLQSRCLVIEVPDAGTWALMAFLVMRASVSVCGPSRMGLATVCGHAVRNEPRSRHPVVVGTQMEARCVGPPHERERSRKKQSVGPTISLVRSYDTHLPPAAACS